jgi:response regulator RpfG family c-di-GMP phosphodiesterase
MNRSAKLNRIVELNLEMANIKDIDILLEKILTEARSLFHADAGSIYIREGDKLNFSYAQNETLRARLGKDKKLPYTKFSIPISDASVAGYVANKNIPLNIADAYQIDRDLPFSFNRSFDEKMQYHTQSMLTWPLTNNSNHVIGVLQLINAMDDNGEVISFDHHDEKLIQMFANFAAMGIERAQLTRMTILRMISMAELRDPKETGPHVNRVAAYALEIYEQYSRRKGKGTAEIEANRDILRMAAMLHDVGKVAISDTILKKPGRFNEQEFEVMKKHTFLGAKLFGEKGSTFDEMALEVALNHHERWDGTGYPGHIDYDTGEPLPGKADENGKPLPKKGKEIPLFGRIVAVADVYDALICKRVYKEAWDEDKVLKLISDERGKQFDPEIVDAFFAGLDEIRAIGKRYPDYES